MDGVSVVIDGNTLRKVQRNIQNTIDRLDDLEPLFEEIGDYMTRSTQNRILRQKRAPDGSRWAPLSPATVKRKGHGSILFETGALASGIYVSSVDGDEVVISSSDDTPYAQWMQEGFHNKRTGKSVPARPFMGISDANSRRILTLVNRYIREANR